MVISCMANRLSKCKFSHLQNVLQETTNRQTTGQIKAHQARMMMMMGTRTTTTPCHHSMYIESVATHTTYRQAPVTALQNAKTEDEAWAKQSKLLTLAPNVVATLFANSAIDKRRRKVQLHSQCLILPRRLFVCN